MTTILFSFQSSRILSLPILPILLPVLTYMVCTGVNGFVQSRRWPSSVDDSLYQIPKKQKILYEKDVTHSNNDVQMDETASLPSRATNTPSWNDYFLQLVEFQKVHGHVRVPKRHPSRLGEWVSRQRQRKSRLDSARIQLLDSIGFCWNAGDDKQHKEQDQWWQRFESVRYQVLQSPDMSLEECLNPSQLDWLRRQRNDYLDYYQWNYTPSCKLTSEQLDALNELDSSWWKTARERQWDVQFQALQEYRDKHGHCNVPSMYENRKLANWVQTTRKKYKKVKLREKEKHNMDNLAYSHSVSSSGLTREQISKLEDIGFNYDPWGQYDDKYLKYC
ncbi:helicase domain protein [Nitzschia inconspicua]|uniref:Helicase domain protein n=1 Tax=Nitzschia inconspicua TaxID=303405 RepID=A0A9K3LA08_9STRA|nr:helicase domain protein [Nitzschia inconspicua]